MEIEVLRPAEIEQRSMEIIESELGDTTHLSGAEKLVVKRVIHATADFDYLVNMKFSRGVCQQVTALFKEAGTGRAGDIHIVTDTKMALSGISKPAAQKLGIDLHCFMADEDVAENARLHGTTRALEAVDKAVGLYGDGQLILVIGNAPTALIRVAEHIRAGRIAQVSKADIFRHH